MVASSCDATICVLCIVDIRWGNVKYELKGRPCGVINTVAIKNNFIFGKVVNINIYLCNVLR